MKFKVEKGTETFQKLHELYARINATKQQEEALMQEVGAEGVYCYSSALAGRVAGFVFDKKPENWKLASGRYANLYYPKVVKANQAIHDKIAAIPVIEFKELNQIVGFKPITYCDDSSFIQIKHVGYCIRDEYCLISVHDKAEDYVPNADMVEILESEYKRLKDAPEP